MNLGYDQKLYILAFDHRGSFQKKFFGIEGEPDPEQTAIIADAKHLIFEGMLQAVAAGADPSVTGVLVDEQFGSTIPAEAREKGLKLAMPVERSGPELLRLPVRRRLRGAHRTLRSRLQQGARPLQRRRRRRGQSRAADEAQAALRTGSSSTTASSCSSCSCRPRTPSSRPSAATPSAMTQSSVPS